MSGSRYSLEQRIWIVKHHYLLQYPITIQRAWRKEFAIAAPSPQCIRELIAKFEESGTVLDAKRSGRPVSVTTDDNKEEVKQHFQDYPTTSTRRGSLQLEISRTSLRRMLKQLKLRPYIPSLVHQLNEDDCDRRVQFCEQMLTMCEQNYDILHSITWSDEAVFKLDGSVNRHNSVYYSTENPHKIVEKGVNSPSLCVWAGLNVNGLIGPFFFQETVTGQSYLSMLSDYLWPTLNIQQQQELIFQQDGAPPHYALVVRNWLDFNLPNRWIGRRGSFCEWPARSPDLTPLDFFLWGVIKHKVYTVRVETVDELKMRITEAFREIGPDLCKTVCYSLIDRWRKCIDSNGQQFEHLL